MKLVIYAGLTIGSLLGSFLPVWFFSVGALSGWSLLGGAIGSIVGLAVGYRVGRSLDI